MKLSIFYFVLVFITGLHFNGGLSFAQSGANTAEIHEDHNTRDLNKLLKNYTQNSDQVIKDAEKMYQDGQELSEKELSASGEVLNSDDEASLNPEKKTGTKDLQHVKKKAADKAKKKVIYSEEIRKTLIPLQSKSEKELLDFLEDTTRGTRAGEYLGRFPRLSVFTVRLVKDKDALPKFVSIADDTDKLIRFAGIMISTILVAYFLKAFMKKEGRSILAAMSVWFVRFLIMMALRLAIVIYFYGPQITPIFKIAGNTLIVKT